MDEIAQAKAEALANRIKKRDASNESILDSMGLAAGGPEVGLEECEKVDIAVPPAKCTNCHGTGRVKSMFSTWECFECHGTGYDLSNAVAVIKWQTACMEWSKARINKLQRELKVATTTEEERMAESAENFYRDSKIKD